MSSDERSKEREYPSSETRILAPQAWNSRGRRRTAENPLERSEHPSFRAKREYPSSEARISAPQARNSARTSEDVREYYRAKRAPLLPSEERITAPQARTSGGGRRSAKDPNQRCPRDAGSRCGLFCRNKKKVRKDETPLDSPISPYSVADRRGSPYSPETPNVLWLQGKEVYSNRRGLRIDSPNGLI